MATAVAAAAAAGGGEHALSGYAQQPGREMLVYCVVVWRLRWIDVHVGRMSPLERKRFIGHHERFVLHSSEMSGKGSERSM